MSALTDRLDRLERAQGPAPAPPSRDGWELVLAESVAYLVDDDRRSAAMNRLRTLVGLEPEQILEASDADLLQVVDGMQPAVRVQRLRRCGQLALSGAPWRAYPSIGPPGVDRIRLFTGEEAVLALDSNGLRVLQRWGYGTVFSDYGRSYRSAQQAATPELPPDIDTLIRAHQLLRRHGKTLCRPRPHCSACPVGDDCPAALRRP